VAQVVLEGWAYVQQKLSQLQHFTDDARLLPAWWLAMNHDIRTTFRHLI